MNLHTTDTKLLHYLLNNIIETTSGANHLTFRDSILNINWLVPVSPIILTH